MTDQITKTDSAEAPKGRKGRAPRTSGPGKPAPRATKRAQLIRLLQSKSGADVATISAKLGWQAHTTRAALTGLRKAGFGIEAEKGAAGAPMRYRITRTPEVGSLPEAN